MSLWMTLYSDTYPVNEPSAINRIELGMKRSFGDPDFHQSCICMVHKLPSMCVAQVIYMHPQNIQFKRKIFKFNSMSNQGDT